MSLSSCAFQLSADPSVNSGGLSVGGLPVGAPERRPGFRSEAEADLSSNLLFGLPIVLLIACLLIGAVASLSIAGAVVANGQLAMSSGTKKVQHPSGGIVSRLLVGDGERVRGGQVLVTLDPTLKDARLAAVRSELSRMHARLDRLVAEREGAERLNFLPATLTLTGSSSQDAEAILSGERQQFALENATREAEREQMDTRIHQAEQEVESLRAQFDAVRQQLALALTRRDETRSLFTRRLTTRDKLAEDEKEFVTLNGSSLSLEASIAAGEGKIAETRMVKLQAAQDFDKKIAEQIDETNRRLIDLREQEIIASDALQHLTITAPQDGVVSNLAVLAPGSIVQPAEPLMEIVPDADDLIGEVKIRPTDVDEVYVGQTASIHLAGLDRQSTPALTGRVLVVSADRLQDRRTGADYYLAKIAIPADERHKLGDQKLIAGMPIEVFASTGDRRILSYLTQPLMAQLARSFR